MSKKYASNDKDKLLVENWKKFMKEGDFSSKGKLTERSWGQMGKDVMKGDFTGKKRRKNRKDAGNYWLAQIQKNLRHTYDDIESAIEEIEERPGRYHLDADLEEYGATDLKDLIQKTGMANGLLTMKNDHEAWADGVISDREHEERQQSRRRDNEAEENRRKRRAGGGDRDSSSSSSRKSGGRTYQRHGEDHEFDGTHGGSAGSGYGRPGASWDE